ncbi:hypothetical protein GTG28_20665 [Vibrio sp. OCN044]|uniref:Uncharacterized protein n=1 Tax=Vibrio tetraodonis subsp. pristinus TaxID=2695891 RepID=A0A6L8LZV7_9VIBR|nr:hypothetical protein [Vibrio tetraodonis]MYM61617.1 hypothetical protein [Vibrio tetraodonis subsp. pristinus]
MKIAQSKVTKLYLTELDDLDPITVYLEDIEPRKGKITIECWGKSWSSYWGGMGSRTISQFFIGCNVSYLVNNLDSQMEKYEPDFDEYRKEMRQKVCELRRDDCISKDLARELFDIEDWSEYVTDNPYEPIKNPCFVSEREFEELDFDGFDVPERLTTEYRYLCKIIKAIQSGLSQINQIKAA